MFIFSHFTSQHYLVFEWSHPVVYWFYVFTWLIIQGDSITRGPKLLSIKSYVIEIITWKFIYTYRERCKTGPAHNRCWHLSPFTSKHTSMLFSRENHPVYICQNNYRVILSLEAPNKFGKSIPEFGETHSSVLGCERRPVSASIMSRSCFASFPVCVYKFSSYYLNNIIFYRQ